MAKDSGRVMPPRGPERSTQGAGPRGDQGYKSGAWALEPPRIVRDNAIGQPVVPAGGGAPSSKGAISYKHIHQKD